MERAQEVRDFGMSWIVVAVVDVIIINFTSECFLVTHFNIQNHIKNHGIACECSCLQRHWVKCHLLFIMF